MCRQIQSKYTNTTFKYVLTDLRKYSFLDDIIVLLPTNCKNPIELSDKPMNDRLYKSKLQKLSKQKIGHHCNNKSFSRAADSISAVAGEGRDEKSAPNFKHQWRRGRRAACNTWLAHLNLEPLIINWLFLYQPALNDIGIIQSVICLQ